MEEKNPAFVLTGYSKGDGKVVHVVVDDIYSLCTRNHKEPRLLEVEEKLTSSDVTCAKCKRTAFFKALSKPNSDTEPSKEVNQASDIEPIEKPKIEGSVKEGGEASPPSEIPLDSPLIAPNENKKGAIEPNEPIETESTASEPTEQEKEEETNSTSNEENEPPVEEIKEIDESSSSSLISAALSDLNGQFDAMLKANRKYSIIHKESNEEFFMNVEPSAIVNCLLFLNQIPMIWNGKGSIPLDFLERCNRVFKMGYKTSGIAQTTLADLAEEREREKEIEQGRDKPKLMRRDRPASNEEEKPKLMRRNKPVNSNEQDRPKLMRRDRPHINANKPKNIFRSSSPKAHVIELISERPASKKRILRSLCEAFNCDKATASVYFTMAIREAVRHKGKTITVTMKGSDAKGSRDLYFIEL